jgi:hypothetical protein
MRMITFTSVPKKVAPMNELQLSRFKIYAPLVRKLRLDIASNESKPNWEAILAAMPNRPLLPGLRTLALHAKYSQQQESSEIVACIDAFLCQSLLDIHTSTNDLVWLNPFHASWLLHRIAETSRGIQTLQIFISSRAHPENVPPLSPYSKSAPFACIGLFRDLRSLRGTSMILDSGVLRLLGDLPRLESLMVWATSELHHRRQEHEISIADLDLTAYSFLALRHLAIYDVSSSVISQLWQTPCLVQRLVSIHIRFPFTTEAHSLLCELICFICQNSLQTTQLDLDLQEIEEVVMSPTVVPCLKQLPLRRLRMIEVISPTTFSNFEPMALALPNLEYLDVSATCLDFQDLVLVAKHMPRLQFLAVNLSMFDWPSELDPRSVTPSPSKFCLASGYQFSEDFSDDDFDDDENLEDYLWTMARWVYHDIPSFSVMLNFSP